MFNSKKRKIERLAERVINLENLVGRFLDMKDTPWSPFPAYTFQKYVQTLEKEKRGQQERERILKILSEVKEG